MKKSITIEIWDDPKCADRYSIAISGLQEVDGAPYTYFLGASANPYHPQGIGQHSNEMLTSEYKAKRGGWKHLGKRITFFELPKDVQRFVASEMMPEE